MSALCGFVNVGAFQGAMVLFAQTSGGFYKEIVAPVVSSVAAIVCTKPQKSIQF